MPFPIALALQLAALIGPHVVRAVSSDKAGDVAQEVLDAAVAVTGAEDPAKALEALRGNGQLVYEFRVKLLELEQRAYELELADRQSAREAEVGKLKAGYPDKRKDVLSTIAILALAGLAYAVVFYEIGQGPGRDLLFMLAGALIAVVRDVYAYEFGSSRSSAEKTEIMLENIRSRRRD